MSKSKKQLLLELLELENENVGKVGETQGAAAPSRNPAPQSINAAEGGEVEGNLGSPEEEQIVAPKKKKELTEKQKEALKKGQSIRDENARKRAEERAKKEEEEKRIMEEKLIKKAIAVKKKQIKKQQMLDELSDEENTKPITKPKKIENLPKEPEVKPPPFVFTFV